MFSESIVHLPPQLLVSELLRARVRDDHATDFGVGHQVWMHPPTHRVLGWASRPSSFGPTRYVWRLNQLHQLHNQLAVVCGEPASTEQATLDLLPLLLGARFFGCHTLPLGIVADAAIDTSSGVIRHYLVSRSDPRLPGTSRWVLQPDRIVDQQPGRVEAAVECLGDLPLARAGIREQLLQVSHSWRHGLQQRASGVGRQLEQWTATENPASTLDNPDLDAIGQRIGNRWRHLQNRLRSDAADSRPTRHRDPVDPSPTASMGRGGDANAWDDWNNPPHRQRRNHDQPHDQPMDEPWL